MAYVFNLWNFYQSAESLCEFDITPANLPLIKEGTDEFIRECLKAFAITAEPAAWTITPFRSYYFSEYVEPNQPWEGRWDIGWIVRVSLRQPLTNHVNKLVDLPVPLDASDATWTYGEHDPRHETSALVVSVQAGEPMALNDQVKEISNGAIDKVQIRSYENHRTEIRRIFQGVVFPQWIEQGDRILEKLRQGGGWVNFRQWGT
jgi:hypothetical protein